MEENSEFEQARARKSSRSPSNFQFFCLFNDFLCLVKQQNKTESEMKMESKAKGWELKELKSSSGRRWKNGQRKKRVKFLFILSLAFIYIFHPNHPEEIYFSNILSSYQTKNFSSSMTTSENFYSDRWPLIAHQRNDDECST